MRADLVRKIGGGRSEELVVRYGNPRRRAPTQLFWQSFFFWWFLLGAGGWVWEKLFISLVGPPSLHPYPHLRGGGGGSELDEPQRQQIREVGRGLGKVLLILRR